MTVLRVVSTTLYKSPMSLILSNTRIEHIIHEINSTHHLPHQSLESPEFFSICWSKVFGKAKNDLPEALTK